MIPSIVARQVRETVLDYLRTTFALSNDEFEQSLFRFLEAEDGLFKGPYADIRLPFRRAKRGSRSPLDIRPEFEPWAHQHESFVRLYTKGGHQPQPTLVTTGTGSGKTECFLYPILDHCWRHRDEPGIKAIILYPMNALATDQARRLARIIQDDDRLRGEVSAGLYVGGEGTHGIADRDHLIDKRESMRNSPPDILLTNYRMLDFLLLRPEDRLLWQHNAPDTLQFLVLDELHTYDGAQGSDVACLIRRLRSRLRIEEGRLCCVGTSATIGGQTRSEAIQALTDFASQVFGIPFYEDAVILEDRTEPDEALGRRVDLDEQPSTANAVQLDPDGFEDRATWLQAQAELWLGPDIDSTNRVELGDRLKRHRMLRLMLRALKGGLMSLSELDTWLISHAPAWDELDERSRLQALDSFLALVSWARKPAPVPDDPERSESFLQVQLQLWVRELRHLQRRVAQATELRWAADVEVTSDEHWLPIAHCRECGADGMAAAQLEAQPQLREQGDEIGRAWLEKQRTSRFLSLGRPDSELLPKRLCPACLRLAEDVECSCRPASPVQTLEVLVADEHGEGRNRRWLARCPECGVEDALSILGSRAPSLLSVAVGHLFQTQWNDDRKLLAFTDSVQDASHRAGFFGARTYRFNLRTAIQGALESGTGPASLATMGEQVQARWASELPQAKLIATLWPPDLQELPEYVRFLEQGGKGSFKRLLDDLEQRLSWEMALEFGYNARIGRSLERTACATVSIDSERLTKAAERLLMEIEEGVLLPMAFSQQPSAGDIAAFLLGLLHRLRIRGGIHHPFLTKYIESGGKPYLLGPRRPRLLSPFGPRSRRLRFLTDSSRSDTFDTYRSEPARPGWYRDWVARSLGVDRQNPEINDFLREVMRALTDAGILRMTPTKPRRIDQVWGLDPVHLFVDTSVARLTCPECHRSQHVAESEKPLFVGHACPRFRCTGTLDDDGPVEAGYYHRMYSSGRLQRIFASEHTGLITRPTRELLEERFKAGTDPDAPNLLVSTPTLEMGIDVGDLSAVVLCSVAPSTANHLQRIGRAGRKTGNALCVTMANSRPHDLYFMADPREMMAGQVLPPGCFLDAPEMLKRQLVAHAMDAWAREEQGLTHIPHQVKLILGKGAANFPGRFTDFYRDHQPELTQGFFELFDDEISPHNRERLEDFAGVQNVVGVVEKAFAEVALQLKDLRDQRRRCQDRIEDIKKSPEKYEGGDESPTAEELMADLEDMRKALGRMIRDEEAKYPLNVMTDAGVLPNYAFPEPGVTLKSVIRGEDESGATKYETFEYMRPASAAIRELAPFNTFYAEGRRVQVDEIEIGTSARPLSETWRLCPACNHMEREIELRDPDPGCPQCGNAGWADAGQRRSLVHFRRARSLASRLDSVTVDETEDRSQQHYELADLIDVSEANFNGARLIQTDQIVFGMELLKHLDMRELNFGIRSGLGQQVEVAGKSVPVAGFQVCLDCGHVQDPRKSAGLPQHAAYCRARKEGIAERIDSVWLYREVQSEALRLLLPVSDLQVDETRASFRAALELGFRRRFKGNPGHLQIKSMTEPAATGGSRQFLVVFDAVPGGTGYLAELSHGDNFYRVLQMAYDAMQKCACQKGAEPRDGCYRCLYAYQQQSQLQYISSRIARKMIEQILEHKDEQEDVRTLSDVELESVLESELERKFIEALAERVSAEKGIWEERVASGREFWMMQVGTRRWKVEAQETLGPKQGVTIQSRPDFLIRPADGDPGIRPIAVFCDGLAYHVCPDKNESRLADDLVKRQSILDSGEWQVWSVTWKDVSEFENRAGLAPSPFGRTDSAMLEPIYQKLGAPLSKSVGRRGSMEMLWAHLEEPVPGCWESLALAQAAGWLITKPYIPEQVIVELEDGLRYNAGAPGWPEPSPKPGANHVAKASYDSGYALFGVGTTADLASGKVGSIRLTLRLFDDFESRGSAGFESSWRAFLQAWNLLQFHPSCAAFSEDGLQDVVEAAAEVDESPAYETDGQELEECLRFATRDAKPLIEAAVTAGLSLPENGYVFGESEVEADIAWEGLRVAVLAESQQVDREAFESAGWTVFIHPAVAGDVIDALRNRSSS